MWAIIKFDKKKLDLLKEDLKKKLGQNCKFYLPKLIFKNFKKNKLVKKEFNLLGNYIFCFHKKLADKKIINNINYSRGLKLILKGFYGSQNEICKFIEKCKISEDSRGYISDEFYELKINSDYQFFSGPFANSIFKIVELQKNKINVVIGNLKTTIKKKEFLFQPI